MFPIKDSIRIPRAPVVTYLIILINTAVFLYQNSLGDRDSYLFSLEHALVPLRYFDRQWAASVGFSSNDYWPFITGFFMHGGWWHLILNMWSFFIFGASLEGRLGRVPFLIFYLLCGVIASATHVYFNPDSTVPVLGASGAIAGIMGAYATTFPRARVTLLIPIVIIPFFFKIPALAFALIWFLLQFVQGFIELASPTIGGGIAWWAHIGGFLAGVALIPLWRFGRDETYDEEEVRQNPLRAFEPAPAASVLDGGSDSPGPTHKRGPWG